MKALFDTHAFIWWDSEPNKLSPTALAFVANPDNEIFLSIVSVWEMIIKLQLGKITLRLPLKEIIEQQQSNGIQILNPTLDHALAVAVMPQVHKDPFDRLLIGQALSEGAAILTVDPLFAQYSVKVIW